MRTLVLLLVLSLAATTVVLLPTSSATDPGGVCSEVVSPNACWGQFVCVGYSTDGRHYWCKYAVEDPCHTTTECFPPD